MLTDESEDIDDPEEGLSSEFVANVKFLTQEWDFDVEGTDTWERRCGEKYNAAVLLRAKQTKFLCSTSYIEKWMVRALRKIENNAMRENYGFCDFPKNLDIFGK